MVALISIAVALITTLIFANVAQAAPNTTRTINFQGRLMSSAGSVVADGNYNLQFKIYQDGDGRTVNNPGGSLQWTETYTNNGDGQGVPVKNGFFSVNLGSVNPFGTSVDWDHDKIWLSMNVAGRDNSCTSFGTNPCQADGEMLPMKQITATPYSLNSGAVGGKTADDLVQLGQGIQTDASNNSSLFINKIGSGNLIQLQNNGSDVFTVAETGNLVLGSGSDKSISLAQSEIDTAGNQLTLEAGAGGEGAGSSGGDLVLSGGAGGGLSGNGGNIILSGGSGSGDGVSGLVILDTPTFSTVTSDANCYTGGAVVSSSCSITQSSVDNSAAVVVGFDKDGQTANLPDPTIKMAGRIMYVIAAGDSRDFTLAVNSGGLSNQATLRPNTAATVIWSGSAWVLVNGAGTSSLQDAYDNTAEEAEIILNNQKETGGLTIRDSATDPVGDTLLKVQDSDSNSILSINSNVTDGTDHASDGGVSDQANFATNWSGVGEASVSRLTTDGQADGDSVEVVAGTAANSGVANRLAIAPSADSRYQLSAYLKLTQGEELTDLAIKYSPDGGNSFIDCSDYSSQAVTASGWAQVTCLIETDTSEASAPYVYLVQPASAQTSRTFLVDSLSFTLRPSQSQNVKVGNNSGGDKTTLFTVDRADSAPTAASGDDLLGSMYYDTSIGKLQCYESEGWGPCGASPDTFVTISPEYSGAVMNGADIGTINSGLCSDALNINDGSDGQPDICGTDEIYNFYNWTSEETTAQTRSIFVTYQLPNNFKHFVEGSTSLTGKTDGSDASLNYQIYRDSASGLTSCGSAITVSSGAQTSWQKVGAEGSGDPVNCNFEPGDNIYFRINLTAANQANAYTSSLKFIFSNN